MHAVLIVGVAEASTQVVTEALHTAALLVLAELVVMAVCRLYAC